MTQILDSIPSTYSQRILCSYYNATGHIQIVRISNISSWYFERVVFPGVRLLFEALPEASLEIHTNTTISTIFADNIPCSQLQVAKCGSVVLEPLIFSNLSNG
ncbi:MAG: DUF1830 domain-containing protein [Rhizonema sp. PD37]|nr:DUF1830 domain-containing protein [Rhizonema sp. PD37]